MMARKLYTVSTGETDQSPKIRPQSELRYWNPKKIFDGNPASDNWFVYQNFQEDIFDFRWVFTVYLQY